MNTKAEGLKLIRFYGVANANEWLVDNSECEIFDISYAFDPHCLGDSKHLVLISYKENVHRS